MARARHLFPMRVTASLVAALLGGAGAHAEEPSRAAPADAAVDEAAVASRLGLGAVRAAARRGEVLYLALEAGGLALVDLSRPAEPALLSRLAPERRFDRLLLSDGALLVFETRHELLAFDLAEPRAPRAMAPDRVVLGGLGVAGTTAPAAPAAPLAVTSSAASARLRVTEVREGRAIFEVTGGSVARGTRVKVISQRPVMKPDLLQGGTSEQPSGEVTAVVELEQVQGRRAMAPLGRGDVASAGDLAEPTPLPLSENLLFPRRAPYRARAGFFVRPYLGLEAGSGGASSKPVGFLLDAFLDYRLDPLPLALKLDIAPLGLAFGGRDAHRIASVSLVAAYSTDFVEIGIGGGGLLGREGPCSFVLGATATGCEQNDGFTFNQVLRLGALDGLNFSWSSAIFSRPDRFVFGLGRAEVAAPLTSKLGLFAAGGGGENGWAFGELGVRTFLGGSGATGTVLVSASLGYAALFDGPANERVQGPSVGFGLEWRL
jgi:hypothetical protein